MAIEFDVKGLKGEKTKITIDGKKVEATRYKKDGKLFYEVKDENNMVKSQIIDLDGDGKYDQTTNFEYSGKKLAKKTVLEDLDDNGKNDKKPYTITIKKVNSKVKRLI